MENVSDTPESASSSNKLIYFLIVIIFILAVILVGVGGFLMGQKNNQQTKAPFQTNQLSLTPTQEPLATSSAPTPTVDEESILKQTIKSALVAEHGNQANSLDISVSKIKGNYASGGATEQGGGGMWFAAKVNDIWKLVWDGNGTISCSNFAAYPDFPTDMVPECWDDITQKLNKR
jgi:hypothetical protein